MTSRNLDAYYFSFEPTGCDAIDAVLESVARAGKGYHNTADWQDRRDDGSTALTDMQAAAEESAAIVQALIADRDALVDAMTQILRVNSIYSNSHAIAALALGELGVNTDVQP